MSEETFGGFKETIQLSPFKTTMSVSRASIPLVLQVYAMEFFSDIKFDLGRLERRGVEDTTIYSIDALLKYSYASETTARQLLEEMQKCEEIAHHGKLSYRFLFLFSFYSAQCKKKCLRVVQLWSQQSGQPLSKGVLNDRKSSSSHLYVKLGDEMYELLLAGEFTRYRLSTIPTDGNLQW